ncbi:DUF4393 domain-containing protein [Hymenobacter psychrotolerans]|uniref:DUF4393 domain-containing protein n=1 Tax=Hymenobacter psychrotolerans DSM 18569 TaxID=1121959 RepID=A0A1M6Z6X1_9BACT|nr:DUF4393 domain-containing protein [Hymenobacter psychrotolerans]SHL26208.1 protein of unknown function [Hymenobacter psychrotolerans DSM 18569]
MENQSEEQQSTGLIRTRSSNSGSGLFGKLFSNVAQPAALSTVRALAKTFDLSNALDNPSWMQDGSNSYKKQVFQQNMNALQEKIGVIPEEKVCEVPPEIGVPTIEKLTYTTNEQLRNAYLNLLAKASSEDTAALAHPAFPGIIERISADEARIIEYLKGKDFALFLEYRTRNKLDGYNVIKRFATGIEFDTTLDFPSNIDAYLQNLLTIGIIDFRPGIYKIEKNIYDELDEKYKILKQNENDKINLLNELASQIESGKANATPDALVAVSKMLENRATKVDMDKGFFDITPFGKLFIQACVS